MTLLIDKLEHKQENIIAVTDLINLINDDQSRLNCAQNARVQRVKLMKLAVQKIDLMAKSDGDFREDCLKKLVV